MKRLLSLGGGFAIKSSNKEEVICDTICATETKWKRGHDNLLAEEHKKEARLLRGAAQSVKYTDRPDPNANIIRQAIDIIKAKRWVVKEADKNLGLVLMSEKKYRELLQNELLCI